MKKLPKELTIVTRTSKLLALSMFIIFPFIGFSLGMQYQQMQDSVQRQIDEANNVLVKRGPTPTPEKEEWKVYTTDKYSISYPRDWKIDITNNRLYPSTYVSFVSPDYSVASDINGRAQKGVIVHLYTGEVPWDTNKKVGEQLGPESIREVSWLGEKATLQVNKYEGNWLILNTTFNRIKYQIILGSPSNEMRKLYEPLFLQIANSLTIK